MSEEIRVEPSPGTYSHNGPPEFDLPPAEWAGFRLLQQERTKRHKEAMRTLRGAVVIFAALVLLLALGDALPWQ